MPTCIDWQTADGNVDTGIVVDGCRTYTWPGVTFADNPCGGIVWDQTSDGTGTAPACGSVLISDNPCNLLAFDIDDETGECLGLIVTSCGITI